jgi:LysM repeat protein
MLRRTFAAIAVAVSIPAAVLAADYDLASYLAKVEAGDTLYGIAEKYNISVETLMWANGLEQNPDLLRLGQELFVLPVNGVTQRLRVTRRQWPHVKERLGL